MAFKLFKFKDAVRGYHYYRKVLVENQELDCLHEVDNPYVYFAIKTCESTSGKNVGHCRWKFHVPLAWSSDQRDIVVY